MCCTFLHYLHLVMSNECLEWFRQNKINHYDRMGMTSLSLSDWCITHIAKGDHTLPGTNSRLLDGTAHFKPGTFLMTVFFEANLKFHKVYLVRSKKSYQVPYVVL